MTVVFASAASAAIDREQLVARVAHVHAVAGAHPVGDPPQPVHAHHVVDAQHRRVATGSGRRAAPQGVPGAPAGAGQLRREPPVLAVLEELVGRRADGHRRAAQVGVGPRLVAGGVASDRQVEGERRRAAPTRARPAGASARNWARRWLRLDEAGRRRVGRSGRRRPWPGSGRSRRRRGARPPSDRSGRQYGSLRSPAPRRRRAAGAGDAGRAPASRPARSCGGTSASGSPASSRYTSFQCSRLTGAYGLGSNGSSRNAGVQRQRRRARSTPSPGSASLRPREVLEGRQRRVVLPQRVGRDEQPGAPGERGPTTACGPARPRWWSTRRGRAR